jgi:multiple sugar transport system substrate-binding protein
MTEFIRRLHLLHTVRREPGRIWRHRSYKLLLAAIASMCVLTASAAGAMGFASGPSRVVADPVVLTEQDYWGSEPQKSAYDWLFNTYEKTHPNVTIKREILSPSVLLTKFLAEASTGTLPSITLPDTPDVPTLVQTGKWAALDSYINKWGQWNSYTKSSQQVVTVNQRRYGIHIGTADLVIFYNKKIFAQAGIKTLPKTWPQLQAVGKRILSKVHGLTYGAISFGATAGCSAGWQFLPWQMSAGGNMSIPGITQPGTVAALSFWVKLVKSGVATKSVLQTCQSTNVPLLEAGKVAMIEDGPWDLITLAKDRALSKIGFFKMPVPTLKHEAQTPIGGEVWMIPSSTPDEQQAAWNFVQWSQTPNILLEFNNRINYLAVRKSVALKQQKQRPILIPFFQMLKGGRSRTEFLRGAQLPKYNTAVSTAITEAILGQKTPLKALQDAQKAAQ